MKFNKPVKETLIKSTMILSLLKKNLTNVKDIDEETKNVSSNLKNSSKSINDLIKKSNSSSIPVNHLKTLSRNLNSLSKEVLNIDKEEYTIRRKQKIYESIKDIKNLEVPDFDFIKDTIKSIPNLKDIDRIQKRREEGIKAYRDNRSIQNELFHMNLYGGVEKEMNKKEIIQHIMEKLFSETHYDAFEEYLDIVLKNSKDFGLSEREIREEIKKHTKRYSEVEKSFIIPFDKHISQDEDFKALKLFLKFFPSKINEDDFYLIIIYDARNENTKAMVPFYFLDLVKKYRELERKI